FIVLFLNTLPSEILCHLIILIFFYILKIIIQFVIVDHHLHNFLSSNLLLPSADSMPFNE
ncbi:MAG TPA: hypothetical protein VIY47_01650, partial [Ignavibacteriaceae bacterium]